MLLDRSPPWQRKTRQEAPLASLAYAPPGANSTDCHPLRLQPLHSLGASRALHNVHKPSESTLKLLEGLQMLRVAFLALRRALEGRLQWLCGVGGNGGGSLWSMSTLASRSMWPPDPLCQVCLQEAPQPRLKRPSYRRHFLTPR